MTNEEMQRAMEFIVEQQARTSVKLDALAQSQAESKKEADEAKKAADERWNRADERWARTEESIRALLAIAELHEREIAAHTQQILALGETTRATDERLNALIDIVERQISERHNGKP